MSAPPFARAPVLRPGDPIAVLAPSGVVDPKRLERGIAYLERRGHPVIRGDGLAARHGYLAGEDEQRAGAFNDIIAAVGSPAIALARGGYGLSRILDRLDLDRLLRRPRPILGYSDATALFMALQRSGPYRVHYGPSVADLGDAKAFDETSLWDALYGAPGAYTLSLRAGDVLRHGSGAGRLIGGCLSLLVSLLGTPYDLDYDGAILFWEEVGEPPYRIDRMLTHLRNAGKLDRLRGMVIGSLTGCEPVKGRPSLTVRQIVLDRVAPFAFPVVWNVRAGHIAGKITLPLGAPAMLSTSRRALTIEPPGAYRAGRSQRQSVRTVRTVRRRGGALSASRMGRGGSGRSR